MTSRRKTEPSTKTKDSHANSTLPPAISPARRPRQKSSQRVQKSEKPRRASARLRGKFPDTPASLGLPKTPSGGCEEQAGSRQRKRLHICEEEPQLSSEEARPAKRARNSVSAVSGISQPLTAKRLERHTLREGYVDIFELMNQETTSQATQKSSYTAAHYRLSILADANIIFRFLPAPEDVCTRIAAIVQRPISKERKEQLSPIAHTLHSNFAPVLSGPSREDDCVELFHQALSALGYRDRLLLPRKIDWEPSFKPRIAPPWNLDFLSPIQDEAEDSLNPPSKRQHGEGPYPSPDTSGAAATGDINMQDKGSGLELMGPPPVPQWDVKTPRPDISIGLSNDAVVDALRSRDLTRTGAKRFLKAALLRLGSTKQEVQMRFPFMPVEGKSYATGKTIYEAQNQAAVSGACALEILHRLDDLAQRAQPSSNSKGQHIVFSVCTQGPIHELWAHYTTEEDGHRIYNNQIWKSCNMAVGCEVLGFLEAIDNVMRWGSEEHMLKIVARLKTVWAAAPPSR
ncbi:MAG: hypothetical protein Q9191_004469 [Dirinaria sp. TL-2023a]